MESERVYEFGPFRLQTRPLLLLREGKVVRLTPKVLETLLVLIENRGRLMEREELLRSVWPDTFVEEKNLTQNISVLRKTLGEETGGIPPIETHPKRGYRFVAQVRESDAPPVELARPTRVKGLVMGAVMVFAAAGAGWFAWSRSNLKRAPEFVLTQLTTDTGLTYQPAISPDGKLLAYASDRAGSGGRDVWVQQLPWGEPIRLTPHEAEDYEPSFSPDGAQITFRSDREGGGVYVVPSLGGSSRRIADHGRRPRFSPDGKWIAYQVGSAVYVVNSAGGLPKRVTPEGVRAESPIWTPDGKHLLFLADFRGTRQPDYDWWVAPLDGGTPTKVEALPAFLRRGLSGPDFGGGMIYAEQWLAGQDQVVFVARRGDSTNLWRAAISRTTWKLTSEPQMLTAGTGFLLHASGLPDGRLVFSSLARSLDIWELPIHAGLGQATGELRQLTHDAAADLAPSVSADGKRMVFESTRAGKRQVWRQELPGGRAVALTDAPSFANTPRISADGSKVAYVIANWGPPRDSAEMYVVPFAGGAAQKVCDRCIAPWDWSADGSQILAGGVRPRYLALIDIRSGEERRLVEHPSWELWSGQLSPDNRWLAFVAHRGPGVPTRLFVAPRLDLGSAPPAEWIPVTDGSAFADCPRWPPDGNLLYFVSTADGFRCIWAQRLDQRTRRPVGPARAVYHLHSVRRALNSTPLAADLAVTGDRMYFTVAELTGNVWMAAPQR